MPSILRSFDELAQRATNRLLARLPGPFIEIPTDRPVVSFTFDDVPDSALRTGAAILEAQGARGSFYIAAGLMGREEPDRRLIDAQGCAALLARGHELGCHTFSHPNLRHAGRAALRADLDRNKAALAALAPGFMPRNFAYPYNAGSFRHRNELTRRYRSARGGLGGINRGPTDRTFLRGVPLQQPESSIAALHAVVDELIKRPGWLIFFGHDIAPNPTPFGCTPESFAALVAHVRARGCAILTVDAALDQFEALP